MRLVRVPQFLMPRNIFEHMAENQNPKERIHAAFDYETDY